jgi:DNA-binding MarR family transcriptional regulator
VAKVLKVGVESAAPPSAPRGDVPGRLEAGDGVVVDEVDERAPDERSQHLGRHVLAPEDALDYRSAMPGLDQRDYERLLAFRTGLRRFLSWSGQQAEAAGITPAQHQLLLAVRGHPDPRGPTVGEIAGYLLVRHHSAVELIDRAVTAGLVARQPDSEDARTVRIALTARGRERLETLAASHLEELARLTNQMHTLWAGLEAEA